MTCVVVPLGPACVDITGIRAGDRNLIVMTLSADGAPLDLTGLTVEAQARLTPVDPASISAVIDVVDAALGKIEIRWPGEEVRTVMANSLTWAGVWDLQIVDPEETDPYTVVAGKFSASMDVTKAAVRR